MGETSTSISTNEAINTTTTRLFPVKLPAIIFLKQLIQKCKGRKSRVRTPSISNGILIFHFWYKRLSPRRLWHINYSVTQLGPISYKCKWLKSDVEQAMGLGRRDMFWYAFLRCECLLIKILMINLVTFSTSRIKSLSVYEARDGVCWQAVWVAAFLTLKKTFV